MQITTPTNIPTLTVGGRVFTDLKNLITLTAWLGTPNWSILRKVGASAGYTPSGSLAFRAWAIDFRPSTATAVANQTGPSLFYADADTGLNNTTALTNRVNLGGDSTIGFGNSAVLAQSIQSAINWLMPNGKYMGVALDNAGSAGTRNIVFIYGYEE